MTSTEITPAPRAAAREPRHGTIPPVRARWQIGRFDRGSLIQWGIFALLVLFVIGPIVPVFYQSLMDRPLWDADGALTLGNFQELYSDPTFIAAAGNSFVFAILSTALALFLGGSLGILAIRTNVLGARWIRTFSTWPIFISPMVLAFGTIFIYGPSGYLTTLVTTLFGWEDPWMLYSIVGMSVTSAIAFSPLVFFYVASSLNLSDASLEAAARVSGLGPWRVIWKVIIPSLRPPLMYSGLLLFVLALEEVTIPLLYGSPVGIETFGSYLYIHGIREGIDGVQGAAAATLLVLCMLLLGIQAVLLRNSRRFISVRGKATRREPLQLGKARIPLSALAWIYLILGPILPGIALLARSFTSVLTPLVPPFNLLTLANFELVFSYPAFVQSIWNSVFVATVGGVIATVVALLAVAVARRSRFRFRRAIEFIALSPQAVPGIVLGFGFFWFYVLVTPLSPVRTTIWGIVIAFVVAFLPMAFGAIAPAASQVADELDQAARVSGGDWWYAMWRTVLPIFRAAMLSSFTLVFVAMMKAVTPALFLVTGDTDVIGTTTLRLWLNGNTGSVAALSIIQIAITFVVVAIASRTLKVRLYA